MVFVRGRGHETLQQDAMIRHQSRVDRGLLVSGATLHAVEDLAVGRFIGRPGDRAAGFRDATAGDGGEHRGGQRGADGTRG